MAADLEEQKKAILPFMQRAQEIQQADPKVAYYCRLYAVEQALKYTQRPKEINMLLASALSQLERDKARLQLDPPADRIHCLGFALRIFDNADRVDRAGRGTELTSKAFYAASLFIEILNHFEGGGVDAELVEKQRYCVWRAAEIRKALREGRQPQPPPSAEGPKPGNDPAGSSRPADIADLPLASGSSDWAYGSANRGQQDRHSGDGGIPTQAYPRAPPPSLSPSFGSMSAAPEGPGVGWTRFWPGAKMLVRVEEGLVAGTDGVDGLSAQHHEEVLTGTVGQVLRRPEGGISYKVALTDRLVEVPDEAAVPALEEGDTALMALSPGQQMVPVKVALINTATWPPTYLVQRGGKELTASAQQLALPPREGVARAASPGPGAGAPAQPADLWGPGSAPTHYPTQGIGSASPQPPSYPHQPPPPPLPYPFVGASTTQTSAQSKHGAQAYGVPAAPAAGAAGWSASPAPSYSVPPGFKPSLQAITDAQKQAKYAVSALSFEDISTAVKNLSEALRLLTTLQPSGTGSAPARR